METVLDDNLPSKPSKLMKISPYIFLYFIFSFLGWIIEIVFCYCMFGRYMERGFLYSSICPIYRNWSAYSYFLS